MLRKILIAVAIVLIAGGIIALFTKGAGGGWGALILGVLLLLGTAYERVRYKAVETKDPGPGWQRTAERFVDEESGKTITVYVRPETGERRYVED